MQVAGSVIVRGVSMSLRMELALEKEPHDIHVCTVMPASIDTPLFTHTANYTGRKVKAMSPTNPPEVVAEAIAHVIEKPDRETQSLHKRGCAAQRGKSLRAGYGKCSSRRWMAAAASSHKARRLATATAGAEVGALVAFALVKRAR